jgi:hypothetical protein
LKNFAKQFDQFGKKIRKYFRSNFSPFQLKNHNFFFFTTIGQPLLGEKEKKEEEEEERGEKTMNLVATSFATQPVCNAAWEVLKSGCKLSGQELKATSISQL